MRFLHLQTNSRWSNRNTWVENTTALCPQLSEGPESVNLWSLLSKVKIAMGASLTRWKRNHCVRRKSLNDFRSKSRRLPSFSIPCAIAFVVFLGLNFAANLSLTRTVGPSQSLASDTINKPRTESTTTTQNTQTSTRRRPDQNGWKRILPSHGGTVYGELDDFTSGKSCQSQRHPLLFWRRRWVCRDCGEFSRSWNQCPELSPRGKCSGFTFQGWDAPRPRSASTYNADSSSPYPVRLLTSYGVGKTRKVEYEQAQCRMDEPCFQIQRCTLNNGTLASPLAVYAYPGLATAQLKESVQLLPSAIKVTQDPSRACLLIVHYDNLLEAMKSKYWNGGKNHYIYAIDKPIDDIHNINFEMAAVGSFVATEAQTRWGYDIPLPLPALWKPPSMELDIHRPRRLLLSFKGSIQDTLQPYYQHRWLAAEYLFGDSGVEIDVQCKHKRLRGDLKTVAKYDHISSQHFDDLMVNSTFGFCPGGSHVTSFRFTEVLSVGSIPVILPEVVVPFAPELDWSGCVVRISQSRIVDLPRILRAMPIEEIQKRQKECHRLFQFIKNEPGEPLDLTTTMKVWLARIKHAVQLKETLEEFNPVQGKTVS